MNFPRFIPRAALFLLVTGVSALSLTAAEPSGKWTPPPTDGSFWKHAPTSLAFPPFLGDYRFAGHFDYKDDGVLLRYENLEEQARMDIFLFKAGAPLPTLEDKHRRILAEMDIVSRDMESMVKQGRYKNLSESELQGGELELWQKQSLPIATRVITATRMGISDTGSAEAVVRQWVGITLLDDYLITLRHMRPAATGDAGEESMKRLIGLVFQVIKDPALRSHIQSLIKDYQADPFSEYGVQAAAAVLAYLQQTPYFPINIPEHPVAQWLEHAKAIAPGTEETLLRAFMLGSAKAALTGGDAETCLQEGSRQFAKIYRQLVTQHPQIARPEIDDFVTAAEKGEGHVWMRKYTRVTQ
ncbi:hypothetical protein SAMN02745166_02636 [Prosthecobacter debontii]|uniref:HEAT repeat domain-containing protein n=1 Tax=Prosthecobacter debontii TaxID=48467 RepID=A0A1T4Y9C3_9BACT|nr:hypothetical protein [Prosthecobacter debontii]SKA97881.1 hypothetical protein SAMN02745166_02636 [Prosthecobacter debontii]